MKISLIEEFSRMCYILILVILYITLSFCSGNLEMYHWNFDHSSTTESTDLNKNHIARLTEARISADRQSLVIEDQGHFVAENISSDLSEDQGFTVSFSVRQTGNLLSR